MRVVVFGNSGSGKTTYARALTDAHGVAHLDLDSIVWEPDRIAVQRSPEDIMAALNSFIETHDSWVIEGCYGDLADAASSHCTELVFLNPGLEACLANNRERPWEPAKYESLEQQNSYLEYLQQWVADYYSRDGSSSYGLHRRVFDEFSGNKTEHTARPDLPEAP